MGCGATAKRDVYVLQPAPVGSGSGSGGAVDCTKPTSYRTRGNVIGSSSSIGGRHASAQEEASEMMVESLPPSTQAASRPAGLGQFPQEDEVQPEVATPSATPGPPLSSTLASEASVAAATKFHRRVLEVFEAYNFFFEHMGLRKGWRTAPFGREEVQAPFKAAAEVVAVVRIKLDREGAGGIVLRQIDGSAMDFLWGWNPESSPGSSRDALEEFFRGLVFATLSDAKGLVEGLDKETVEQFVCIHPLLTPDSTEAWAAAAQVHAAVDRASCDR